MRNNTIFWIVCTAHSYHTLFMSSWNKTEGSEHTHTQNQYNKILQEKKILVNECACKRKRETCFLKKKGFIKIQNLNGCKDWWVSFACEAVITRIMNLNYYTNIPSSTWTPLKVFMFDVVDDMLFANSFCEKNTFA